MTFLLVLKIIAAVATIATGLLCALRPQSVTDFIGLTAPGVRGVSEIRAIFGGAFIGLGAIPLALNSPLAYQMLGGVYLFIAVTRALSIVLDKSYAQSNLISLGLEGVCGVVLVL